MEEIVYQRSGGKKVTLPKGYNVNDLQGQMKSGGVKISFVGEQIVVSVPGYIEPR
jgi:hypothetical protein